MKRARQSSVISIPTRLSYMPQLKAAHDRGIEQIKAGVSSREIDRVVRTYIEEKGFGAYFGHGTGHGVGLDVHEPPRIRKYLI